MTKKTRKRSRKTRKQKVINMIGCSKKHKHNKSCKNNTKNRKNLGCPNCGPNCHCGPKCNCPHPCPGSCYLNNRKKMQKAGSCGSSACPMGGLTFKAMNQFGGNCGGTCSIIPAQSQSGGNFFKPASPIPGPFVGSSWGTSTNEWPGTNGIGGDRNYLASYAKTIGNDPQLKMSMADSGYKTLNSMVGGYVYKNKNDSSSILKSNSINKSKSKSQKGGLIPQDLVNLGNNFTFNLKSAYNSLNGYNSPANPLPYKDQLLGSANNKLIL